MIQETIGIQSGATNVRPIALAGERADAAIRQLLGLEVGEEPQSFLQGHRRDVEDTGQRVVRVGGQHVAFDEHLELSLAEADVDTNQLGGLEPDLRQQLGDG